MVDFEKILCMHSNFFHVAQMEKPPFTSHVACKLSLPQEDNYQFSINYSKIQVFKTQETLNPEFGVLRLEFQGKHI